MFQGKLNSTSLDNLKRRLLKIIGWGNEDVHNIPECAPYGLDSNPINGMSAIWATTGNGSRSVCLGYINLNQLAKQGEFRMYSTDSDGNMQTFVWLTNNGNIQLGGTADNAVRYSKLNAGLQDEVNKINIELSKIQIAIAALGGSYTPTNVSLDISAAKINNILTP